MSDYDSMREAADAERRLATGRVRNVDVKMTVRATVILAPSDDLSDIDPMDIWAIAEPDNIEIEEVF